MGRVCHGPSLLWAEMSRNPRDELSLGLVVLFPTSSSKVNNSFL